LLTGLTGLGCFLQLVLQSLNAFLLYILCQVVEILDGEGDNGVDKHLGSQLGP
jgi:hypothetical protein